MSKKNNLGQLIVIAGGPDAGKTTFIQRRFVGAASIVYDYNGDTQKGNPYSNFDCERFAINEREQFLDYISNPDLEDFISIYEEPGLYYKGRKSEPRIDNAVGPRKHKNSTHIFPYYSLYQVPNDILDFQPEYFVLFPTTDRHDAMWSKWKYTSVFDAWEKYQTIWNDPKDQIEVETPHGIIYKKPPLIFNPNKPL
jgi:hypothetical protein